MKRPNHCRKKSGNPIKTQIEDNHESDREIRVSTVYCRSGYFFRDLVFLWVIFAV